MLLVEKTTGVSRFIKRKLTQTTRLYRISVQQFQIFSKEQKCQRKIAIYLGSLVWRLIRKEGAIKDLILNIRLTLLFCQLLYIYIYIYNIQIAITDSVREATLTEISSNENITVNKTRFEFICPNESLEFIFI